MTIFNTGPNAVTMDFNAGDVGYVKKNLGHYIKNTGDTICSFSKCSEFPISQMSPSPTGFPARRHRWLPST